MDTTSPTRTSSKLLSIALAAGVGLWLTAFTADMAVAEPVNKQSTPVLFGDLDLRTEAGAKTLLTRITKAARSACGELTHSALLPRESAHHRVCVADAVDAAVARVDAPMLAALHKSQPDMALAAR
jgi:UrcA family protein